MLVRPKNIDDANEMKRNMLFLVERRRYLTFQCSVVYGDTLDGIGKACSCM